MNGVTDVIEAHVYQTYEVEKTSGQYVPEIIPEESLPRKSEVLKPTFRGASGYLPLDNSTPFEKELTFSKSVPAPNYPSWT